VLGLQIYKQIGSITVTSKKQSSKSCRLAYSKYLSSLVDHNSNTVTKRLWTLIKNKKKDHTGVSPLVGHDIAYNDPQDKADLLVNYFSSFFTAENIEYTTLSSNPLPDVQSIAINPQGIQHLLCKLQIHKSWGPDNIPA